MVAVVLDYVVLLRGVLGSQVLEVVVEDFLGDFGGADLYFFDGFAVGGLLGGILADAASEIVLFAVDEEGGVVDGVDLLSEEHHAHVFGHSHGEVVDCQHHFFRHFFPNSKNY